MAVLLLLALAASIVAVPAPAGATSDGTSLAPAYPPAIPLISPSPEIPPLISFLESNGFGNFSRALQSYDGLLRFLSSLVDGEGGAPLTIFAPVDDAFYDVAVRLGTGKYGKYCSQVSEEENRATLLSTILLHIVQGFFPNDDLVPIDYLTPFTTLTPVPLYALPGFFSSSSGSIQVGTSNGREAFILSWADIVQHDAYSTSKIIVHALGGVITYPVVSRLLR